MMTFLESSCDGPARILLALAAAEAQLKANAGSSAYSVTLLRRGQLARQAGFLDAVESYPYRAVEVFDRISHL